MPVEDEENKDGILGVGILPEGNNRAAVGDGGELESNSAAVMGPIEESGIVCGPSSTCKRHGSLSLELPRVLFDIGVEDKLSSPWGVLTKMGDLITASWSIMGTSRVCAGARVGGCTSSGDDICVSLALSMVIRLFNDKDSFDVESAI